MNKFFQNNIFIVDEKVTVRRNRYTISDADGRPIGRAEEHKSFLKYIISRAIVPNAIDLFDENGNLMVTLSRGWTFWMPKYTMTDASGLAIATIKTKFKLFKVEAEIADNNGIIIAHLHGDWKAWEYQFTDANGNQVGTISKKWNGAMKELFTTADKYVVGISPDLTDEKLRMVIASSAVMVDSVYKENK